MAALIKIDHSFTSRADRPDAIRFCSRCGQPAEEPPRTEEARNAPRVCEGCGMGLLLSCLKEALPGQGAAFLIVTADLGVSAVSLAAESLFGPERTLLGSSLLEVLTSPMGESTLGRSVAKAAMRAREPVVMPVRGMSPSAVGAGMLAARISTCGPPRGALVTVEPSGFGLRG